MLNIQGARIDYGAVRAFSGFSLEVASGEMVSIIGKSGCGKTSLLYAAAGLLELTEGTISLSEGPGVIMFQQDRLLPWKTALSNILLGFHRNETDRAIGLLDRMGLKDKQLHYPCQLSGGERQRIALARCLMRTPRLLLLDEPLASLDEQTREHLQGEIKEYVLQQGITMVLVTHSIQEAVYMGSRIVIMTPEGVSFAVDNPHHRKNDLRQSSEFFQMERILRSELGEVL